MSPRGPLATRESVVGSIWTVEKAERAPGKWVYVRRCACHPRLRVIETEHDGRLYSHFLFSVEGRNTESLRQAIDWLNEPTRPMPPAGYA